MTFGIAPLGRVPIYCSERCGNRYRAADARAARDTEPEILECHNCHTEFTRPSRLGTKPSCCSTDCYNLWRGYVKPALEPRVCALPECMTVFVPAEEKTRCCSERHGKTLYNREYRAAGRAEEPWSDRRRENYHRRVARKKGATVGEPVQMEDIAERDGWICQLCRKRVPRGKAWPHPLSPSLDHIIPLSHDAATHEPANVQLAHLRCNTAKGNRAAGEQLRLIG